MWHRSHTSLLQIHGWSLKRKLRTKQALHPSPPTRIVSFYLYHPYCLLTPWEQKKKKSIPSTITTSIPTHRPPPPLPTPQPVCHPGWQPRSRHSSEDNGCPGGDYTPGECKAPTLQSDKSTTHPHLTLRPLLTSLPGIILLWDEIDLRHAGHVGENWFQRVLGTYLQMKAANQPGGWE